jgi:hypothetical protein
MWLLRRVLVDLYTFNRRTDTCLSFDSGCFSIVQASAPRFVLLVGFNDVRLYRGPQRDIGSIVATSKAMFAINASHPDLALQGARPYHQMSHRAAVGRGAACG